MLEAEQLAQGWVSPLAQKALQGDFASQPKCAHQEGSSTEKRYLDVTVNNIPRVEVLQGRDYFSPVEAGTILSEDPLPGQVEEELEGERKH